MGPNDFDHVALIKSLTIKDLRVQTRARGLSPAGCMDTLRERLTDHMLSSQDFSLRSEDGSVLTTVAVTAGAASKNGDLKNNYSRPGGQNVGNFLTDRASSRVLAPPGGGSQIVFGDEGPQRDQKGNAHGNNYSRPGGQNVGNFIGDRPSSRVSAPAGGKSQIVFG
uniref:SAP domain-containing protein n=1 Tax=Chlamydomonas euryale TaxID=1486919 RepID=A0A7R9V5W1_9CHLO